MPVIPINERVRLITGPADSRFPYANAFFVDDEIRTLVDAGCDESELRKLGRVDRVICTHYHLDHIRKVWLFPDAELWVPDVEAHVFRGGLDALASQVGLDASWAPNLPREPRPVLFSMRDQHEWRLSLRPPTHTYGDGAVIACGETKIETIRMPGHTPGHTCPFFQKENLLHLVDVDLSPFGPWYGGKDGDLEAFERSIQRLLKFPATEFTTAHATERIRGEGVRPKLEAYLAKIGERDEKIVERLRRGPLGIEALMREGIVFPADRQAKDDWIALWERNMLSKHLERLARIGRVRAEGGGFAAA